MFVLMIYSWTMHIISISFNVWINTYQTYNHEFLEDKNENNDNEDNNEKNIIDNNVNKPKNIGKVDKNENWKK